MVSLWSKQYKDDAKDTEVGLQINAGVQISGVIGQLEVRTIASF